MAVGAKRFQASEAAIRGLVETNYSSHIYYRCYQATKQPTKVLPVRNYCCGTTLEPISCTNTDTETAVNMGQPQRRLLHPLFCGLLCKLQSTKRIFRDDNPPGALSHETLVFTKDQQGINVDENSESRRDKSGRAD